jgi:hypothetical protein
MVKSGVQFSLWGGSVLNLGSESHRRAYFDDIGAFRLPGCFAMTELKHGSNVRPCRPRAAAWDRTLCFRTTCTLSHTDMLAKMHSLLVCIRSYPTPIHVTHVLLPSFHHTGCCAADRGSIGRVDR